jgi:hypothetical protein
MQHVNALLLIAAIAMGVLALTVELPLRSEAPAGNLDCDASSSSLSMLGWSPALRHAAGSDESARDGDGDECSSRLARCC